MSKNEKNKQLTLWITMMLIIIISLSWTIVRPDDVKITVAACIGPGLYLLIHNLYHDYMEKDEIDVKLSTFTQNAIFEVYKAIKEYLSYDDLENMNEFCNMLSKIDKYKVAIPPTIFSNIVSCVADIAAVLPFMNCQEDDIDYDKLSEAENRLDNYVVGKIPLYLYE